MILSSTCVNIRDNSEEISVAQHWKPNVSELKKLSAETQRQIFSETAEFFTSTLSELISSEAELISAYCIWDFNRGRTSPISARKKNIFHHPFKFCPSNVFKCGFGIRMSSFADLLKFWRPLQIARTGSFYYRGLRIHSLSFRMR